LLAQQTVAGMKQGETVAIKRSRLYGSEPWVSAVAGPRKGYLEAVKK